jgi:hypothetical protein
VRREHDRRASGHLVELLDKHRALALEVVDDEAVVHDLVAHVDRRTELGERLLDDGDRAVHAGAEAPRIGEHDVHHASFAGARGCRKLSTMSMPAPTVIALSAALNAG